MRIIGLDYGLTSPCCTVLGEDGSFEKSTSFFLTDKKKLVGQFDNVTVLLHKDYKNHIERYENIATQIFSLANLSTDDIVVIEDYSLGSKGKTFNLSENCGIMKYLLYKQSVSFVVVPPSVVKKQFTGKGNADKDKMYDVFFEKTKIDLYRQLNLKVGLHVMSPISDIVDSYALAIGYKNENC